MRHGPDPPYPCPADRDSVGPGTVFKGECVSDDIAKRDDQTANEPTMVSPQTGRQLVALVDNVESLAAATGRADLAERLDNTRKRLQDPNVRVIVVGEFKKGKSKLINALAGLITAGAPEISDMHARSLRDGLRSVQLAFREASAIPDPIGKGPGEKWTGPVS